MSFPRLTNLDIGKENITGDSVRCYTLEADNNILIRDTQVPTVFNVTYSVPYYFKTSSTTSLIGTLECEFMRIKGLNTNGFCFIKIPAFSYPSFINPYVGVFFLDLSSFSAVAISGDYQGCCYCTTVNDGTAGLGRVYFNGTNQTITIYKDEASSNFNFSTSAGISFNAACMYIQAFL